MCGIGIHKNEEFRERIRNWEKKEDDILIKTLAINIKLIPTLSKVSINNKKMSN